MWRDFVWKNLLEAGWVILAAVAMGTFVGVSHLTDYGPIVSLDVGATTILVPLVTGIALGLLVRAAEPQPVVLKGFAASLGAIVFIGIALYAPVVAGVVPRLESLGTRDLARLAALFTSLFIVPVHLVGNIIGFALQDMWTSPEMAERNDRIARP